jgi:O-antigen/teichoic acid export membrane protein
MLFRIFSLEEFGVWGLFMMVTSVVEVARSGLIQNAIVRYLSISPLEEHPKIISASFSLNAILSSLTIVFILLGAHTLSVDLLKAPELEELLYYYIITTIILLPFFQFQYIQQANLNFKGVFWAMFFRQGLYFSGILFCFASGEKPSLLNLVYLQSATALAGTLVGFLFTRGFLFISSKLDFEWIKKLFDFGKFGFVTNLSSIVSGSIDQGMLSNMISTEAVALQRAALQITNAVEVPTNAMADIVFPQSARRMHADGKGAIKYLYEKSVGVIVAIIVPFLLVVLLIPGPILSVVTGGGEYLKSIAILQVTVVYTVIIPFDRQAGTIFDSTGKQKLNFYLQIMAMVVNFVSNLYFIREFGIIGAAYGTLVTYLISFLIKQLILKRSFDVEIIQILKYAFHFYGEAFTIIKHKLGLN